MHGRKYIAAKVHANMLYFIGMSRLVESIRGTCELQSNLMASTLDSVFRHSVAWLYVLFSWVIKSLYFCSTCLSPPRTLNISES